VPLVYSVVEGDSISDPSPATITRWEFLDDTIPTIGAILGIITEYLPTRKKWVPTTGRDPSSMPRSTKTVLHSRPWLAKWAQGVLSGPPTGLAVLQRAPQRVAIRNCLMH